MPNIISDSSNPLQPAAARLEPLHDQLDDARNEQLKFADWCQQKAETCQFLHWATVLQLELTVMVYVHSFEDMFDRTPKEADGNQMMELFHELGCGYVSVDSVIRLGKMPEDEQAKPRPLLVSEEQKDKVLRQSKNLRMKYTTEPNRLFVHQDLTPKQREARRRLVAELKQKQTDGENNLMIVNGKTRPTEEQEYGRAMQGSPH